MKKTILLSVGLFYLLSGSSQQRTFPTDTVVSTNHTVTIRGQKINYVAHAGMQSVYSDKGDSAIASLNFTYYKRTGVSDVSKRPLLISFNGGPGSASVWMHLAYTGPSVLKLSDEGDPVQPYGYKNNPHSVLDAADILYVNPVNTGYSRILQKGGKGADRKNFFGINADIKYLAAWLTDFMNQHNRWLSPKFLIGESYGGTRVSGLAHELQQKQWMYLNGVILVSPADYKTFESDRPLKMALFFPYYVATAWYHQLLPVSLQQKSLDVLLPEAEQFTLNNLLPALSKGSSLPNSERKKLAEQMADYTSLPASFFIDHQLAVPPKFYWKNLLQEHPYLTVGRLDSRYKGLDRIPLGNEPDYNAELTAWLHAFTPAINHYQKNVLNFNLATPYQVFGDVHPWDRTKNDTREQLRKAMAINPQLNVMFQCGLYDGATTYFHAKYTMWQLDPSGNLNNRMSFKTYPSGHMMYLRKPDLKQANEDLRAFILSSINFNKAIKYE